MIIRKLDSYNDEELKRIRVIKDTDSSLLSDSDKEFLISYNASVQAHEDFLKQSALSKAEAEQKVATTFWGLSYDQTGSMFVARVVMMPYQLLVWFIKFLGILLIPYQSIKNYTKEIFPIAFSLGVIVLMLFNGVYISIDNIDALLFENTFVPFMWWGVNLVLIGVLFWTTSMTIRQVQKTRIMEGSKNLFNSSKSSLVNNFMNWIWVIVIPLILVGIPIVTTWSSSYMNFKLFQISSSSLFWYVAYLTYLFITSISLYNIFKRSIYFIFATMDREYVTMRKQLFEIGISLLIILILNGFLTINFLVF